MGDPVVAYIPHAVTILMGELIALSQQLSSRASCSDSSMALQLQVLILFAPNTTLLTLPTLLVATCSLLYIPFQCM